ncbi:hypothetical protein [Vreelandella sp. TE19]
MSTQAPTISLVAGTTYRFSAAWASEDAAATPVDLAGCEAVFVVATTQGAPLLTSETGNGITLDPERGGIDVHIRPEQTVGAISPAWSGARYELRVTFPNGDVFSLLRGHFQLHAGVIHG